MSSVGGFNPTWQRHVAAYDLCAPLLGEGPVVDLGCGVGHSFERLAPRRTVGVDVDAEALAGQDRETVVADMRALPFVDRSFHSVIAVQSIEHVPDPDRAVEEAARVLAHDGVAVFVTPNRLTLGRPDEIIDPYHHVELDARELRTLCERSFGDVDVRGLFGSERYMELFDAERRQLARLLRLDPARMRRAVPRRLRQRLYDLLLRRYRRTGDGRAEAIGVADFELRSGDLDRSLDLVAICRSPLPRATRTGGDGEGAAEVTHCAWCGAALEAGARRRGRSTRCGRCGAYTTDPRPTEDELRHAYGAAYRPPSGRRFALVGDRLLRRSRAHLAGRLDRNAPPGAILDVGAGEGVLVDALRRRGRAVEGLERAPRRADLRDQPITDVEGSWAAIVFWHSLEHLPEPGRAAAAAAALLAPRGLLAIAVPDASSLQARAFGDRWLHLDPPRHLVHLTSAALIERLLAWGLTVERVSRVRGGQILIGWLDGLVGSLPGGLELYQALRRPEARSSRMAPPRRAAAIGAGVALLPVAGACAAVEVAIRRSGTVYVEARRG